jgi:hypothetical protein
MQVSMLLALELIIFPTGCGWWLDLCSLGLTGMNFQDRIDFASKNPCTANFL